MKKFETSKWTGVAVVFLIVLITAIYAMTTWETSETNYGKSSSGSSQLKAQDAAEAGLQAQPNNQNLNGGANSTQLQQGTGSEQGIQSTNEDIIYPTDPKGCHGNYPVDGTQIICMAP